MWRLHGDVLKAVSLRWRTTVFLAFSSGRAVLKGITTRTPFLEIWVSACGIFVNRAAVGVGTFYAVGLEISVPQRILRRGVGTQRHFDQSRRRSDFVGHSIGM